MMLLRNLNSLQQQQQHPALYAAPKHGMCRQYYSSAGADTSFSVKNAYSTCEEDDAVLYGSPNLSFTSHYVRFDEKDDAVCIGSPSYSFVNKVSECSAAGLWDNFLDPDCEVFVQLGRIPSKVGAAPSAKQGFLDLLSYKFSKLVKPASCSCAAPVRIDVTAKAAAVPPPAFQGPADDDDVACSDFDHAAYTSEAALSAERALHNRRKSRDARVQAKEEAATACPHVTAQQVLVKVQQQRSHYRNDCKALRATAAASAASAARKKASRQASAAAAAAAAAAACEAAEATLTDRYIGIADDNDTVCIGSPTFSFVDKVTGCSAAGLTDEVLEPDCEVFVQLGHTPSTVRVPPSAKQGFLDFLSHKFFKLVKPASCSHAVPVCIDITAKAAAVPPPAFNSPADDNCGVCSALGHAASTSDAALSAECALFNRRSSSGAKLQLKEEAAIACPHVASQQLLAKVQQQRLHYSHLNDCKALHAAAALRKASATVAHEAAQVVTLQHNLDGMPAAEGAPTAAAQTASLEETPSTAAAVSATAECNNTHQGNKKKLLTAIAKVKSAVKQAFRW